MRFWIKRGNACLSFLSCSKISSHTKCPGALVLSFAFTFLCTLLLLLFSVLFGEFVLLSLHLVRFLFLLRVFTSLGPLLLLSVQHLFQIGVLIQCWHSQLRGSWIKAKVRCKFRIFYMSEEKMMVFISCMHGLRNMQTLKVTLNSLW